MPKKHTEQSALSTLKFKRDCKINDHLKVIQVLQKDAFGKVNDLGNKSLGKIDFLTGVKKYTKVFVPDFVDWSFFEVTNLGLKVGGQYIR